MIEAKISGGEVHSDLPRIFRRPPQYLGRIDQLPAELINPHVLHVTILKADPIVPFAVGIRELANRLRGRVEIVSALGGEAFYSGWCLSYGTTQMFDDAGMILLEAEKPQRLDVPAVVGSSWGLRGKKLGRGARSYSALEIAVQHNLGAQLYRVERLLVGALKATMVGNPAVEAQFMLEDVLGRFKTTARGKMQRSEDAGYAYRRLRQELGPKRLQVLYGIASTRAIGARFEEEGHRLSAPSMRDQGWLWTVPELALEMDMLEHLLILCQRASRMQYVIDRNIDLSGLERFDDPVLLLTEQAATELLSFGSIETNDSMPNLMDLTRIAFDFDCNAADLYPSLGSLGLHLAAACALGRRSRGVVADETAWELWGLRGLANARYDIACFSELKVARQWLRARGRPETADGAEAPPPLPPRDGLYNVPIVVKPGRR